jgi:hypothetical protein
MSYTLVDGALEQRLTDKDERERWLLLEDHPDFKGHWRVNGFGKDWKYDLPPWRRARDELRDVQERFRLVRAQD